MNLNINHRARRMHDLIVSGEIVRHCLNPLE